MRNLLCSLLWLLALTAPITSSISAFRSKAKMKKSPFEVITNTIVRNVKPNDNTRQCIFFQDWIARYHLGRKVEQGHHREEHYVYYFVYRCLDANMKVLMSDAMFGPTENPKRAHNLPPGCVAPEIPEPEQNPCTGGFELGEQMIEEISTLVSKKILHNPEKVEIVEEVSGIINPKKIDTLISVLPELEEILERTIEEEHIENPDNIRPDETHIEEDGTRIDVFHFPNGDYGERVEFPDGTKLTSIIKPDDSRIDREEIEHEPITVTFSDPEGYITEVQIIEDIHRNPEYEKVTTYDSEDKPIGKPYTRPKSKIHVPIDISIPEKVQKDFDDAAEKFSDALENFVETKVKCFAENIIDVKKNYLTFVCASSGHKSIKDALKHSFGDTVVCGKHVDCKEIENELVDQMLLANHHGTPIEDVKVVSDHSVTTLEARETSAN